MAIIGELAVSITAKTTDFIKGTDKAGKATNKFAKNAKSLKDKMLGLHTVLATFAGVAGLGALSQRFLAVAESMQLVVDRADQLQMSTKALSQLQHAAKRSGVEFDDLVGLLEEMQIRLTEATAGTGSAVDALSRLRLSANELAKSKPEEALETIADALAGIVGMEKIALADAIFGGDGFKALKLIGDGGDAIRKLREEAEALGASFEGDEIQAFTDNMNRLSASMQAMQNKFVIDMSPGVSEVIEGLMLLYEDSKRKKSDVEKVEDLRTKRFLEKYNPMVMTYNYLRESKIKRDIDRGIAMGAPGVERPQMGYQERLEQYKRFGFDPSELESQYKKPGSAAKGPPVIYRGGVTSPVPDPRYPMPDPSLPMYGPNVPVEMQRKWNREEQRRHEEHMKKLDEAERRRKQEADMRALDMVPITISPAR